MAPPPRPPIICYDLHTNNNARRISGARPGALTTGSAVRNPKVTLIPRNTKSIGAIADAVWGSQALSPTESEEENTPTKRRTPPLTASSYRNTTSIRTRPVLNTRAHNEQYHQPNRANRPLPCYNLNMVSNANSYRSGVGLFGQSSTEMRPDPVKARHAYGEKLRSDAEERERRREHKKVQIAMQAQLEDISSQLESAKRMQQNLLKTFGMSHNAARYIQQQDQEYAKLREKVDQFAETRAKELGRRVQQMKQFQQLQRNADEKADQRRVRDLTRLKHCRQGLSSTLNDSLTTNSPTSSSLINTTSSLSTISPVSTCSSSPISMMLTPETTHQRTRPKSRVTSILKNTSTQKTVASPELSMNGPRFLSRSTAMTPASTHSKPNLSTKITFQPPADFSFYKPNPLDQQTLEITDTEFFNKVEDKTMLEVNELLYRMQSELKDLSGEIQ